MKVHKGCSVRLKSNYPKRWRVHGTVLRINWANSAEVKWAGPNPKILMHELSDLEFVDYNEERLESIHNRIPHLQNMVQVGSNKYWKIAKPIAAPELRFWTRVKNAWLVLTGKAFIIRWY